MREVYSPVGVATRRERPSHPGRARPCSHVSAALMFQPQAPPHQPHEGRRAMAKPRIMKIIIKELLFKPPKLGVVRQQ